MFRLLISAGGSRFTLFSLQRETMGGGDWWWHGEGAWNCPYMQVRATMASDQKRGPAFGAVQTCVPELFPEKLLLFLDGAEWKTVRGALVKRLTAPDNWAGRAANLPAVISKFAPVPCNLDTITKPMTDKMVAAAVWCARAPEARTRTGARAQGLDSAGENAGRRLGWIHALPGHTTSPCVCCVCPRATGISSSALS